MAGEATEVKKDLAYYEEHPEELDKLDPIEVEALMNGQEVAPAKPDDKGAKPAGEGEGGKPAAEATPGDKPAGDTSAQAGDTTADGAKAPIQARDGVHTIPYAVLENTRQELGDTKSALDEAQRRNQELQQQLAALQAGKPADQGQEGDRPVLPTDDKTGAIDFDKLREEYPEEIVNALEASYTTIAALNQKVEKLDASIAERAQAEEKTVEQEIQDAIDRIPQLAEWQSSGSPMWDAAVAVDMKLRHDPEYANKSFHDRFCDVVKTLTGKDPREQVKTTEQPSKEELERRAAAVLEKAGTRTPHSLSDIPGGTAPAQNEREAVESLTVTQLESKFEKMTPQQIDEYLSRVV